MITDRQKEMLKIIAEEYIKTAKPVSSNHICKKLKCSSATIRNEMAKLEELHLLEKNHFASGRIPSEEGYKYYVDHLMKPKNMTGEDMLKLQTIFHNHSLDLNDTIKKSIEIVSEITNYTAVVLGNSSKENRLKKVEIVPLEDNKILSIVITDKGIVQHKILYLPNDVSTDDEHTTEVEESTVIVNYVTKDGTKLTDSITLTGPVGTTYETVKKEFDKYSFIEVKGEVEGTYTKEQQEVTYIYDLTILPPQTGVEANMFMYVNYIFALIALAVAFRTYKTIKNN